MKSSVQAGLGLRSWGSGPVVLMIPGLAGLAGFWSSVAGNLSSQFHVVAIDHPGAGASAPAKDFRIGTIAQQVVELLDELAIWQCVVVGHSTGGLIAQTLALDHADRVRGVVLSSTWARPDRRFRELFRLRKDVLQCMGLHAHNTLGQLLGYPGDWYEAQLAGVPASGKNDAAMIEFISCRIDMLLHDERASELGRITVPTRVIGARDDNIIPYHHAIELAQRIPGARLSELSGGHFTPVTRTTEYAELIMQFLGEDVGV